MDEEKLLAILSDERKNSIGFEHDDQLAAERERALNYYKGEMPDVPALPNRSKAVSTDVADAIETIVPDLVEIFVGEDVATFTPVGPEDEDGAKQETDYVNHVFFDQNPGFLTLTSMFKDACLTKTGVVKWWWDDPEYGDEEVFEGKTAMEAQSLQQYGEITAVEPEEGVEGQEPTYSVTLRQVTKKGCIKVRPVPPEDFTVARDTIYLPEATYCAMRSRRRAQDLILDGIDEAIVDQLTAYSSTDEALDIARDTAEEHEDEPEGIGNLRLVEVVEHHIRIDGKLLRVLTGNDEKVLISSEEVEQVQVAAITPFIVTHRFYGESVADKLLEVQQIKTALTRMALDSGYFALNQRMQVDVSQSNEWTLSDLMRNEPMMPVRVNQIGAVAPIQSAGLSFDAFGALEYFSVEGEKRSGVVRNAQGLNPDTLHDTAKGALALMSAAQRRVRFIARVFAETGVKDMFLGIHALVRKHVSQAEKFRFKGDWQETDPTQWGNRNDMTIDIGLGSSGREMELQTLKDLLDMQKEALAAGLPLVTPENIYNTARRYIEKAGLKGVERYLTDPSQVPPQPEQPDPEQAKMQAQLQLEQQKAQIKAQADQQHAQIELQITQMKIQAEGEIARYRTDQEGEIARYRTDQEIQLKREQMGAEIQLKRELAMISAANPGPYDVHVGGDPG